MCWKVKTYICGTLCLDIVPMKAKIKQKKKGESTYCHKGQVLAQVGQDKRDVKHISTLQTAYIVETEKKNLKDETMKKPEIKPHQIYVWHG